ncbi:alanine transaminase OS=Streptomyces tendae OX=1932 GN=GUR47_30800 PE=3 SV=1 [Streptomyces tendae]
MEFRQSNKLSEVDEIRGPVIEHADAWRRRHSVSPNTGNPALRLRGPERFQDMIRMRPGARLHDSGRPLRPPASPSATPRPGGRDDVSWQRRLRAVSMAVQALWRTATRS